MAPFVQVVWPSASTGLTIEATATFENNTIAETHNVTLPSGITSGEILLLVTREGRAPGGMYTPSGWTHLVSSSTTAMMSAFYRVADGTEGSTVAVTIHDGSELTGSGRMVAHSYRISGAETTGTPVAGAVANTATVPSLTPAWGSAENLWLAFYTDRYTDWTLTALPTNYTNAVEIYPATSSDAQYSMVAGSRLLTATTEQPGLFTRTTGANGVVVPRTITLAVRPAT